MEKLTTIKVKYKPGKYEMLINEKDFDEKIHEKIVEKSSKKVEKKEDKEDIDKELKAIMGE